MGRSRHRPVCPGAGRSTLALRVPGPTTRLVGRSRSLLALASLVLLAGCASQVGDGSRAHESPLDIDLTAIDAVVPGQPVLVVGRVSVPEGRLDCPLNEGCWIAIEVPDDPSRSFPWYLPMSDLDARSGKGVVVHDDQQRDVPPGSLVRVRAVVIVRKPGGPGLDWTTSIKRIKEPRASVSP